MKKYWLVISGGISLLLIIYLLINFTNITQLFRYYLIQFNLIKVENNVYNPENLDLRNFNSISSDYYIFYYPKNYEALKNEDSLIFTKDLSQIADVKISNLNSQEGIEFEKSLGNLYFSRDENLENLLDINQFINDYLLNKTEDLVQDESFMYISNDRSNEEESLAFKKYEVVNYTLTENFKFLGFREVERPSNQIIFYSNKDVTVLAKLTMPNVEEAIFFTNLLSLISTNSNFSTNQ
jgi:hypothetical protein